MLNGHNIKTADHLMHLVVTRNSDIPNFSLLLGSGASGTSGIKTAQGMITEWRRLLFRRSESDEQYQEWLDKQNWFNHEDEYSILFEAIYDLPSQRRVYVEECIKNAHPSWGYVYLTNLLRNRFFDVVFTTNFDDLINEACYLYSDGLRPIVAAHDSAVQGIRVTSGRPKIIKLHGDFLYDNIKNTLTELETLEANTKRKFNQFAQEYGLVVLGYSGRDRSVMDTIDLLLRDDENYKQGVYWCIRSGANISGRLESLLRRERIYLVEVDGFDEFMAELHNAAEMTLPKPIAQPFEVARDRARLFVNIDESLKSHFVIGPHSRELLANISIPGITLPSFVHALRLSSEGKYIEAVSHWEDAYQEDPSDENIAHHYADALVDAEKYDDLVRFLSESPLPIYHKIYYLLVSGKNEKVVELATQLIDKSNVSTGEERQMDGLEITRINRAIALKRLGRNDEMMSDIRYLEEHGYIKEPSINAGIAALKGNREEMFAALSEALYESITPRELMTFPVFEDYRCDPEFQNLFSIEGDE